MSPPREIELKFDVSVQSLPRLTASSLLKGASKSADKPVNLVSVYFDTNKLQLHQKGLSLRVRRIGRHHVQTIKQENNGNAALFARVEWEHDVPTKQPDLNAARDTALAPLLNKKLRRALKPMFETHVRRKVFQIRSGQSEIELSIDKGKVEAGRKSSPLCEVELELKSSRGKLQIFSSWRRYWHTKCRCSSQSRARLIAAMRSLPPRKLRRLKPCRSHLLPNPTCTAPFRSSPGRACIISLPISP